MSSEKKAQHPYHLVEPSPWPLIGSMAAFLVALGAVFLIHAKSWVVFGLGIFLLLFTMFGWWRDVIHEGETPGLYSAVIRQGLRLGVGLFIVSEIMFFIAFFWAFFDASLFPKEAIGGIWPPKGIETLDPFHLPYLNTLILLLSGTTVTWAHYALLGNNRIDLQKGLTLTVILGMCFLCVQGYEYIQATFPFSGGIYASTFYMATGFHGAHVFIGVVFLTICLLRAHQGQFTSDHHVGFEAAAWYWHFVDVVWLFLFISIYWWGGKFHF